MAELQFFMVLSDPLLLFTSIYFSFSHLSLVLLSFLICLFLPANTSFSSSSSSLITQLHLSELNLLSFLPHTFPLYSPATSSPNLYPLRGAERSLAILRVISSHFSFHLISHLAFLPPLLWSRYMFERAYWAAASSLLHKLPPRSVIKHRVTPHRAGRRWRHSACCSHYKA